MFFVVFVLCHFVMDQSSQRKKQKIENYLYTQVSRILMPYRKISCSILIGCKSIWGYSYFWFEILNLYSWDLCPSLSMEDCIRSTPFYELWSHIHCIFLLCSLVNECNYNELMRRWFRDCITKQCHEWLIIICNTSKNGLRF